MAKQVLAIEPYYQGSHLAFLDDVMELSSHQWSRLTLPGRHWKWRMRSAPLALARKSRDEVVDPESPQILFCSEMLDLPTWRGLMADTALARIPTIVYFHESQWTYPRSPGERIDHHYGYTNLLTAIAADLCLFNSNYHRDTFVVESEAFIRRMPDSRGVHAIDRVDRKCRVIPPGFHPPETIPRHANTEVLRIGWVHRWEHDKRPDRFVRLIEMLAERQTPFQLILLGGRSGACPQALAQLRKRFAAQIRHDGYAENRDDYWRLLGEIDVVVSTADHEFFGVAVCEAVWAGAAPVLPNRLSYPELFPAEALYASEERAVESILACLDPQSRSRRVSSARVAIEHLRSKRCVDELDRAIEELSASRSD